MKGEILYKILNSLKEGAQDQADFTNAAIRAGYGAGMRQINYEFSRIQNKRITLGAKRHQINKFNKYLSKLKSEGLIIEDTSKHLSLSESGRKKLANFENSFSLNRNLYKKQEGDRVTVISYDIPVAFNKERAILRDILSELDFHLVHKSVWVGRVILPKRFIADLNRMGILDYVEILEVTKSGTLKSKN